MDLSVDRLRTRREVLEAGQEVGATRQQMEQAEARLGDVRLERHEPSSEQFDRLVGRLVTAVASLWDQR